MSVESLALATTGEISSQDSVNSLLVATDGYSFRLRDPRLRHYPALLELGNYPQTFSIGNGYE